MKLKLWEVGSQLSQSLAMNKQITEEFLRDGGYSTNSESLRRFETYWDDVCSLTLLDRFRARLIFDAVERSIQLPGDCVEFGCFKGGISLLIGMLLREHQVDKRVYCCDSFEGLSQPNRQYDRYYEQGQYVANVDEFAAEIKKRGLDDYCKIKEGWFESTLKKFDDRQQFCFAHVDCDIYEPAVQCLEFVYPRLQSGSRLIFDDYYDGSRGITSAVNDWIKKTNEVLFMGPAPQAGIIKDITPSSKGVSSQHMSVLNEMVTISLDWLLEYEEYRVFLQQVSIYYSDNLNTFNRFKSIFDGNTNKTL